MIWETLELAMEVGGFAFGQMRCSRGPCGKPAVALLLLACQDGPAPHAHGTPACAVHLLSLSEFIVKLYEQGLEEALAGEDHGDGKVT